MGNGCGFFPASVVVISHFCSSHSVCTTSGVIVCRYGSGNSPLFVIARCCGEVHLAIISVEGLCSFGNSVVGVSFNNCLLRRPTTIIIIRMRFCRAAVQMVSRGNCTSRFPFCIAQCYSYRFLFFAITVGFTFGDCFTGDSSVRVINIFRNGDVTVSFLSGCQHKGATTRVIILDFRGNIIVFYMLLTIEIRDFRFAVNDFVLL